MNISLNPSYFCNFRCDFCYLTKTQLGDHQRIDLDRLDDMLAQVQNIEYVDIYGGEYCALPKQYAKDLKAVVRRHYAGEINIITNLSVLREDLYDDDISVAVSYDFDARERHEEVFMNMLMLPKRFSILTLASRKVIDADVDQMIAQLNVLTNLDSVEIKPYSANQANDQGISNEEYEQFIIKWLESPVPKNFRFANKDYIERSLNHNYNAYSDDHVYITPSGKFGVLEFDDNDKEFFLEMETMREYEEWAQAEKGRLSNECRQCKYLGRCLTEHYRFDSCSGFFNLLEYYERMEG